MAGLERLGTCGPTGGSLSFYLFRACFFVLTLLVCYNSGDEVKKTEMGRTCGTYGGEERCIQGFSGET
jgi:hypothetical protein